VDKSAAKTTFTETPVFEVPPPIEVDAAEHTTTGHIFVETWQLALTLLSPLQSLQVWLKYFEFSKCFLYPLLTLKILLKLRGNCSSKISELERKEDIPLAIEPILLSLVHQSVTQQQATSGDLPMTTVETEFAPIQMAPKHGEG